MEETLRDVATGKEPELESFNIVLDALDADEDWDWERVGEASGAGARAGTCTDDSETGESCGSGEAERTDV